jgi:hypothetical protein
MTPAPADSTPIQHAAAVNSAVAFAETLPALVNELQKTDPAIADQLTGSLATYSKSGLAPIIGLGVGYLAGRYGLSCTEATQAAGNCWTPQFIDTVSTVLDVVGTAAGAAVMHWLSKRPAQAVLAAPSPPHA